MSNLMRKIFVVVVVVVVFCISSTKAKVSHLILAHLSTKYSKWVPVITWCLLSTIFFKWQHVTRGHGLFTKYTYIRNVNKTQVSGPRQLCQLVWLPESFKAFICYIQAFTILPLRILSSFRVFIVQNFFRDRQITKWISAFYKSYRGSLQRIW